MTGVAQGLAAGIRAGRQLQSHDGQDLRYPDHSDVVDEPLLEPRHRRLRNSDRSPDVAKAQPAVQARGPCLRGEIVTIYGINFGATIPPVLTGQAAPVEPLARVGKSVVVRFGSKAVTAEPLFVGLSPGSVGLYQVNVKIPEEAETGTVEVWISIDGVETNRVLCAIV